MEYRRLGKAGVKVSALSLGSWVTFGQQIGDDVAAELMKEAYDAGVNFFDNAEAYASGRSEIVMGNILKKMGWAHESYVVSSKVFWGGDLSNSKGAFAQARDGRPAMRRCAGCRSITSISTSVTGLIRKRRSRRRCAR